MGVGKHWTGFPRRRRNLGGLGWQRSRWCGRNRRWQSICARVWSLWSMRRAPAGGTDSPRPTSDRPLGTSASGLMGFPLLPSENWNSRDSVVLPVNWEGDQVECQPMRSFCPSENVLATVAWALSWERGSHAWGCRWLDSKAVADGKQWILTRDLATLFSLPSSLSSVLNSSAWAGGWMVHQDSSACVHLWFGEDEKRWALPSKSFLAFKHIKTQKRISMTTTVIIRTTCY